MEIRDKVPDDLDRERLKLDEQKFATDIEMQRERLRLEQAKSAQESRFFSRNFGVLMSAATAFLGISLSAAQVWVASIQASQKEREAKLQNARELEIQERKDLRDFVVGNYSQIMTGDDRDRERMKNLMLLTYSAPIVKPVIEALSQVSPEAQQKTWNQAQIEVASIVNVRAWAIAPPEQAWCYQEEKPAGKYGVYCHTSASNCNDAKRGSKTATICALVSDLSRTGWHPAPRGWKDSWWQNGMASPLPLPFPQP